MSIYFSLIFRLLKNGESYLVIIVVTCAIVGEGLICDECTCTKSIINCTETGLGAILDLWDHTPVLKEAIIMHFDHNNIVRVKELPPSKVKYLSIQHNKINTIDNMAFKHLNYLVELDLSYNFLTTDSLHSDVFKVYFYGFFPLKPGMFVIINCYSNYGIIMLQVNQDESSGLDTLTRLRLDYNHLHSLLPNVFKELSNLVSLSLTGNPLVVIDRSTSFALTSLPMLKV